MITHFKTITAPAEAEYKDRGSRFIAYAFAADNIDAVKKKLKALREAHPKAAHHCTAYRLGADGQIFRASDDGEPAGSAGKPILSVIDSKGLTNTAVIVVRYFGGTLLGVPGLINAYKTAASFALQLTAVIEKPVLADVNIEFDYTVHNEVMKVIKQHSAAITAIESGLFYTLKLQVPVQNKAALLQHLNSVPGIKIMEQ